ncbi:MAG: hypothetical protein FWF81_11740 [Defluviitaleaceae bacterium]|nr:hypothetical protein [Defluviitaleaceae bacterium]
MLLTLEATSKKIAEGSLLHIAGAESLLKKLPKGNWIGGSTEYFMAEDGGKISDERLFVTGFPYKNFSIKTYSTDDIKNVANDGFDNGFSIVIIPFDSDIHREYAENAPEFENMFMHNITGWISGVNLGKSGQSPISINGLSAEASSSKAVALHLEVPADKVVNMGIINIFEQDTSSPLIEFTQEGFVVKTCLVGGKEVNFAEYIEKNNIDTKMPLVGDYSGSGVNVSIKSISDGTVYLYAPVFNGIQYRVAKNISDYENAFRNRLSGICDINSVFSCNCILNFLYGGLEGKKIEAFAGPITFGEIAYQLVNQTLVYVTVS